MEAFSTVMDNANVLWHVCPQCTTRDGYAESDKDFSGIMVFSCLGSCLIFQDINASRNRICLWMLVAIASMTPSKPHIKVGLQRY